MRFISVVRRLIIMFWNLVGAVGLGAVLAKAAHNRKEDEKRKNTPCNFEDGITEAQFIEIAKKQQKKIKRLNEINVHGPVVYGVADNISKDICFCIDNNSYNDNV